MLVLFFRVQTGFDHAAPLSASLTNSRQMIKTPELEQALLVLPFSQVESLANFLVRLLAAGLEVELCARCAVFLLRVHQVRELRERRRGRRSRWSRSLAAVSFFVSFRIYSSR